MPGLRDFYEQLVEQGSVNGIQSPWEKTNIIDGAYQLGIGPKKPFIIRGTQRLGKPESQYWSGPIEAAAVDAQRLSKIMASNEGIKFTNRQLILNTLAVRPEKNFIGSLLSGPIGAINGGRGIPRSARTRRTLEGFSPLDLQFGFTVEPTFKYTRDEKEGNILRLFKEIQRPEDAFKTEKIKEANASTFRRGINTYSNIQNNKKVDPSKLSQPRFSLNGIVNQYDEDSPYTGSANIQTPKDRGYLNLVNFSDASVSQSFVDFRDIDSEAPNVMNDRAGQYTYKEQNIYTRYGFARSKTVAGRDFTEYGQLSEVDLFYYDQSFQTPTKAPEVPDLIDVHFRILDDTDTVLYFRSAIEITGDAISFNWNQETYVGRIDPVHYFSGVNPRQIQFTLRIMPHSAIEMEYIWRKLNLLVQFASPSITNNSQIKGTFLELTIGDYLKNRRGYITDLSFDANQEMYWESNTEGSSTKYQLPRFLEVGITYQIVDVHPSDNRKFYFGESGVGGQDIPSINWFYGDAVGRRQ